MARHMLQLEAHARNLYTTLPIKDMIHFVRRHRKRRTCGHAEQIFQREPARMSGKGIDRAAEPGFHSRGVHHMVKVLVSQQEGHRPQLPALQPVRHSFGRIHQQNTARSLQNPAVGLGNSAGKVKKVQHLIPYSV